MIVVKSNLAGDLRRFSMDPDITFPQFCALLARLYDLPPPGSSSALLVKYTDEEGDLLSLTNDVELSEAVRVTKSSKTPILRVTLSLRVQPVQSVQPVQPVQPVQSLQPQPQPPVVYIQGKPFVPSSNPAKPDWEDLKKSTVATTVIIHKQRQPEELSAPADDQTESNARVPTPQPLVVTPVVIIQPHSDVLQQQQNLASMCASLAESISRVCSDTSNSLMKETNRLSQLTTEGVQETSTNTSKDMSNTSSQSVFTLAECTRKEMERLSDQAILDVNSFVASTTAASRSVSDSTFSSIADIPGDTIARQNEALHGLESQLARDVAEVVRQTLAASLY